MLTNNSVTWLSTCKSIYINGVFSFSLTKGTISLNTTFLTYIPPLLTFYASYPQAISKLPIDSITMENTFSTFIVKFHNEDNEEEFHTTSNPYYIFVDFL